MGEPEHLEDLPRAPSTEAWNRMTPEERRRVVDALPSTMTELELTPPEGDGHRLPARDAEDALDRHFRSMRRSFYIGVDLIVYYPDFQRFAPDVFVVFDVEPGERDKWVVDSEGRGLDFALEILYGGNRDKDLRRNVELYAAAGIPEYFVYEPKRQRIHGFRLASSDARRYTPILAQSGLYHSAALDLRLGLEEGQLRFFVGQSPLVRNREVITRLNKAVDETQSRYEAEVVAREAEVVAREAEVVAREAEVVAREAEVVARKAAEAAAAEARARNADLEAQLRALRGET